MWHFLTVEIFLHSSQEIIVNEIVWVKTFGLKKLEKFNKFAKYHLKKEQGTINL